MKRQKSGGRSLGTPNRITAELKERINDFLNNQWQIVENEFENLESKDKLQFIEKLLPYAVPKMQTVAATIENPLANFGGVRIVPVRTGEDAIRHRPIEPTNED